MNSTDYKSYISYYWISWIAIFVPMLLMKFLHVPIIQSIPIHDVYFVYWIVLMFVGWFEAHRLKGYLVDNQFKKHEEVAGRWPGTLGGFRFIFSSSDLNDTNANFLKLNYRKFLIFMVTVFIGFPIFSILGATIDM